MSVNFVLYVTCKEISEGSLKTLQLKLFLASTHHTPPSSSQPRQLPLAYCSQQNATQDLFYASRPHSSPKQAYLFNLAYVCFLGRGFCSSDMNFQQSESQQKYCLQLHQESPLWHVLSLCWDTIFLSSTFFKSYIQIDIFIPCPKPK